MTGLFEGFDEETVTLGDTDIFARIGGSGPPVLLVHGYPQTSAMWHRLAPVLAEDYRVIVPDMPGYGRSSVPAGGPERYAKRRLAADMVALMEALGHPRFALAGHDRGARVGYRLALDQPDRLAALILLDIVPTGLIWRNFTAEHGLAFYHWLMLAQPEPLPEMLIGPDPVGFLDYTIASWTAAKDLSAFDPAALAEYRAAFSDPARINATCNDYRAGATIDRAHDEASLSQGETISVPALLLWGAAFKASGGRPPLDVWRVLAPKITGSPIDCGHFVCEEAPDAVLPHVARFLSTHMAS